MLFDCAKPAMVGNCVQEYSLTLPMLRNSFGEMGIEIFLGKALWGLIDLALFKLKAINKPL